MIQTKYFHSVTYRLLIIINILAPDFFIQGYSLFRSLFSLNFTKIHTIEITNMQHLLKIRWASATHENHFDNCVPHQRKAKKLKIYVRANGRWNIEFDNLSHVVLSQQLKRMQLYQRLCFNNIEYKCTH